MRGHRKEVVRIQSFYRGYRARISLSKLVKADWVRVFDPSSRRYFWSHVRRCKESQWKLPFGIRSLFEAEDDEAVERIQSLVRGFLAKRRTRHIAAVLYSRFYDAGEDNFYWRNNRTGETSWEVSRWLVQLHIPLSPEDEVLYAVRQQVKSLQEALKKKEEEIEGMKHAPGGLLLVNREGNNDAARDLRIAACRKVMRSKHMSNWTTDQLAAWLMDMKMNEYIPLLYKNKVDGLLFVNLAEKELREFGIHNSFHLRKLAVIMNSYRKRYERRKALKEGRGNGSVLGDEEDEEDGMLSEYAPSELSELLEQEDAMEEQYAVGEQQGQHGISNENNDDASASASIAVSGSDVFSTNTLMEEAKREQLLDQQNISIDVTLPGDNVHFPGIGDIVRVRYTCTLQASKILVSSTKMIAGPEHDYLEFVLGMKHTIKGIDRALPYLSVGQRALINVSAEYAYGSKGFQSLIPPYSNLMFDLTLISFRRRPAWRKQLIQTAGLSEKPYEEISGEDAESVDLQAMR